MNKYQNFIPMKSDVLNFTLLMKDEYKWDRDLNKIKQIIRKCYQDHLKVHKINVLWGISPDSPGDLSFFYLAFKRPISRVNILYDQQENIPELTLYLRQIHLNKNKYEQEKFLKKSVLKDNRLEMAQDKLSYRKMKSLLKRLLNNFDRYSYDDASLREKVLGTLENLKTEISTMEATVFEELQEKIKNTEKEFEKTTKEADVENQKIRSNSFTEGIRSKIEDMYDVFQLTEPLVFDFKDRLAYKSLSEKPAHTAELSSILSLTTVQKIPGTTINLDAFSLEKDMESLLSLKEETSKPISYDEFGNISYIHAPSNSKIDQEIALEKNRRFKNVFSKRKNYGFFYRFVGFFYSFLQLIQSKITSIFSKKQATDSFKATLSNQKAPLEKKQQDALDNSKKNASNQSPNQYDHDPLDRPKEGEEEEEEEEFYDAVDEQPANEEQGSKEGEEFHDALEEINNSEDKLDKMFSIEGLLNKKELLAGLSTMEKVRLVSSYALANKLNDQERGNLYALANTLTKETQLKVVQAIINNKLSVDEQADLARFISNENISIQTQAGLVKFITKDIDCPKERREVLQILTDRTIENSKKMGMLPILGGDFLDKDTKIHYLHQIKNHGTRFARRSHSH